MQAECHCGACTIALISAPERVTECNCSICRRYGALWTYYHPRDVDLSGVGATHTYAWGDRNLTFHRCANCGCVTHWAVTEGPGERMGVNARLLPPEALQAIPVQHFDGAAT